MWKVTGSHEKNKIKMVCGYYGFGFLVYNILGDSREETGLRVMGKS